MDELANLGASVVQLPNLDDRITALENGTVDWVVGGERSRASAQAGSGASSASLQPLSSLRVLPGAWWRCVLRDRQQGRPRGIQSPAACCVHPYCAAALVPPLPSSQPRCAATRLVPCAAFSVTPERAKLVDFVLPYYYSSGGVSGQSRQEGRHRG